MSLVHGSGRLGLIRRTRKKEKSTHYKEVTVEPLDGRKKHEHRNLINYESPFQMLLSALCVP